MHSRSGLSLRRLRALSRPNLRNGSVGSLRRIFGFRLSIPNDWRIWMRRTPLSSRLASLTGCSGSPILANERTALTLTFACSSFRDRNRIEVERRSIVFPSSSTAYRRSVHCPCDSATSSRIAYPSGSPRAARPYPAHTRSSRNASTISRSAGMALTSPISPNEIAAP